jgi:nitrite reductase (NADH) small subunit
MKREACWTPITNVENIPLHEGRTVMVNGEEIAIFNLGNRCLTIESKCPHKGGPLCDGIVSGTAVVCPLHGRRFDLETGMAVRASEPSSVATFPTRVEDGVILVHLGGIQQSQDEAAA